MSAMEIGARTEIFIRPPLRAGTGQGTSRVWARRFNGHRYSFTAVKMPDGERRYEVSRFDGEDGAPNFGHLWTRVHNWTVRADGSWATWDQQAQRFVTIKEAEHG